MGPAADQINVMELTEEEGIQCFASRLEEYLLSWLTEGRKGLILADLRGGTPYNRAELLLTEHGLKERARVISGMNLPMIVDAVLRDMDVCSMDEIADLVRAARDGIMCLDLETRTQVSDDE